LAARPDLLKDAVLSKKEKQYLEKLLEEKKLSEEVTVSVVEEVGTLDNKLMCNKTE